MTHYIRAHYRDGSVKLGNLDGQAAIRHRRPRNSSHWKNLGVDTKSPSVYYWTLSDERDVELAKKFNPNYQEPANGNV